MNSLRGLIIIPCFNEAGAIAKLIDECLALKPANFILEWIVVNDGSVDDTYSIAVKRMKVLNLPINLGIGAAVQTGIYYASQNDFDFCIQLDGDGQHIPNQIGALFSEWQSSGANLVIGSRFLSISTFRSSFVRRLGIAWIRGLLKVLANSDVSDPTSGFRLIDRKGIALFSAYYPHDFPEPVALLLVKKAGLRIAETSVEMNPRLYGKSSISTWKSITYMIRVTLNLLFAGCGGNQT